MHLKKSFIFLVMLHGNSFAATENKGHRLAKIITGICTPTPPSRIDQELMDAIQISRSATNTPDLKKIEFLIDQGARINSSNADSMHYSPLLKAVHYGYFDATQLLITKGAQLNTQDMFGNTPLHLAVKFANRNVGTQDMPDDLTDTHWVESVKIRKQIIQLLIVNNANPHIKNNHGKKPVDCTESTDIKALFPPDTKKQCCLCSIQ